MSRSSRDRSAADPGRARDLASGAALGVVGTALGRGVDLLTQILLARRLGPATFGLFALGWTIFRIARIVSLAGLDKGVIRFGSPLWAQQRGSVRKLVGESLLLGAISSCLLGGMLVLLAPAAAAVFDDPDLTTVLRWFGAALPLLILLKVGSASARIPGAVGPSVFAEHLLQPVLFLLAVLWVADEGLDPVLASFILSLAVGLAWIVRHLTRLFPPPAAEEPEGGAPVGRGELLAFSATAALGVAATMLVMWTDRLFVGYFRTTEDVGLYHSASQLAAVFPLVVGSLGIVFGPLAARLWRNGEVETLRRAFVVVTRWAIYLTLPAALAIFRFAPNIVSAVFGEPYRVASKATWILCAGQMINAATGPVGLLLIMIGKERQWLKLSGFALALNIVLDLLLIPRFGITGAAVATSCSLLVLFGSGAVAASRRPHRLLPWDRNLWKVGLPAVAALLVLHVLPTVGRDLATSATAVVASFLVFGTVRVLLGLDAEEKQVLRSVLTQASDRLAARSGGVR